LCSQQVDFFYRVRGQLLDLLTSICSCNNIGAKDNQDAVLRLLLSSDVVDVLVFSLSCEAGTSEILVNLPRALNPKGKRFSPYSLRLREFLSNAGVKDCQYV
jgi:hypothetical protein